MEIKPYLIRTHNPLVPGSSPGGPTNKKRLLRDLSFKSFFNTYHRLHHRLAFSIYLYFFKKVCNFFILKYHRAYVEKESLFSLYSFQPSLQCAGQFFS